MAQDFAGLPIRFFLGDVRDKDRLYRAFDGVDTVIHAAALKQIVAVEYNPIEAVKTNVMGAANIVDAAIDRGVRRVIGVSTDKAANPVNLYGATKLCLEKLLISANNYTGQHPTKFSAVRYGNVAGSRGSVIPFFLEQKKHGVLTITDERMTRFFITLDQAVDFIFRALHDMKGGEIFVPKIPSVRITDVARALAPECETKIVGIRPGEKLHEVMVTMDESRHVVEEPNRYIIYPQQTYTSSREFCYSSDVNKHWLSVNEIIEYARNL